MAALTAAYDALAKSGEMIAYPMGAGAVIWKGALVCLRADGYLYPARNNPDDTFAGVAIESVSNAGGPVGGKVCRVIKRGTYVYHASGLSRQWVGQPMYASDDNTFSTSSTAGPQVGTLVDVLSSTLGRVRIDLSVC